MGLIGVVDLCHLDLKVGVVRDELVELSGEQCLVQSDWQVPGSVHLDELARPVTVVREFAELRGVPLHQGGGDELKSRDVRWCPLEPPELSRGQPPQYGVLGRAGDTTG